MRPDILARVGRIEARPEAIYSVAPSLPEEVRLLLASDYLLARLFDGKGKRNGDTSDAGYDAALIEKLLDAGVTSSDDLVTACAWRPCYGFARLDDADQVKLTRRLSRLVDAVIRQRDERERARPTVDQLVVYQAQPPIYEVHARGEVFRLSMAELMSVSAFARRYGEACRFLPTMPRKASDWIATVNALLDGAQVVSQPEEASEEGHIRDIVADVIRRCPVDDEASPDALDRGLIVESDGKYAIKFRPLLRSVAIEAPACNPGQLGRVLRELGAEPTHNFRHNGAQMRVWLVPVGLLTL